MEFEVFLVSVVYWISVLGVIVWLNKRLSSVRDRLATLEAEGKSDED